MSGYFWPLLGGALLGLASALLFAANGRILGVSGILGGALKRNVSENGWRWAALAGMLAAGAVAAFARPEMLGQGLPASATRCAAAGLLVGVGTQLGSGCTSGHGICGVARLSKRSLVATLTFIAAGAITVAVVRHVLGGMV